MTEREAILHEAADLTGGDRNKTYGDPAPNLALTYRLFGEIMTANSEGPEPMGEAEAGALMLVCAKLARIATGPAYHRDNYVDAAAYMAIAGEVAQVSIDCHAPDLNDLSKVWAQMTSDLETRNIVEGDDD